MSERAAPFYCPYCGDEHLEPYEGDRTWYCRDCVRAFRLKYLGTGAAGRPMGPSAGTSTNRSMTGKTTTPDLPDRTETETQ